MSKHGSKRIFSPQFERDYLFYSNNKDHFTFAGTDITKEYNIIYSPTGKSAKMSFYKLDSEGKLPPTSEPELLTQILICKAAVNLQIKMWAQSRAEYTLSQQELKEYLKSFQAPDWVFNSVEKQKAKILQTWSNEKKYQSDYYRSIFGDHIMEFLQNNSS